MTNLIAEALCRQAYQPPVVNAGADQSVNCSAGACTASVMLSGRADSFVLDPGAALSYGWALVNGPAPVTFGTPNAATSR